MTFACGSCYLLSLPLVHANPQGMTVAGGSASATTVGSILNLNVSDRAVLNWQSFNIAAGEKTVFNQPSSTSVVWNQILDSHPSSIFGAIQANGIVVLANQQGFWFGPDSVVKTAGFIATTSSAPPMGFFSGGPWSISNPVISASIINYGQIEVASGGSLFLIAEKVENHGVLSAPDGTLGLYAGKEVVVSDRPDGRGFSAKVTLPEGSVDNMGKLIANAGSIALYAQVVNQGGLVQADSVREVNGVIEFFGSDAVTLGPGSQTLARGDQSSVLSGGSQHLSPGGQVVIRSDAIVSSDATATVSVAGGTLGGDGGRVELSAPSLPGIPLQLDGKALPGFHSGQLFLDPATIIINDTYTGTSSGTVNSGDAPATLRLPTSAFANFSKIILQATSLIDIFSPWTLNDVPSGGASLTLQSGGNITFEPGGSITAGSGWQVNLSAGAKFSGSGGIVSGTGTIGGTSPTSASYSIKTQDGALSLTAGSSVNLANATLATGTGALSIQSAGGAISTTRANLSSAGGTISLIAAQNIGLSSSSINSSGGNISIFSQKGNLNASPTGAAAVINAAGGNVSMEAGGSFSLGAAQVGTSGKGAVNLKADLGSLTASTAVVTSQQGDISLWAWQDINFALNSFNAVRTTDGGNIAAKAQNGSIVTGGVTGGKKAGYVFAGSDPKTPYSVSKDLGGFSTANGGNVDLNAALDVTSYLPVTGDNSGDAGTGAYGAAPGNVTINAGGNVFGHYTVANGMGSITANLNAGTPGQPMALSLISGSWTVQAPVIGLQEVRNPNGVFNAVGGGTGNPNYHFFDYSPTALVSLVASDTINLLGGGVPRVPNSSVPIIYPPSLYMSSGIGGINVGSRLGGSSQVILFPSPSGQLDISIPSVKGPSQQGGIQGFTSNGSQIVMSDSGKVQYKGNGDFGENDHAEVPVHQNDNVPVSIQVAGSIDSMHFGLSKRAIIKVGQDLTLSSIYWQNIHPSDESSLTVAGNIYNPNDYRFATLGGNDAAPDLSQVINACPPIGVILYYDPATRNVVIKGKMTVDQENQLKNFMVYVRDANGNIVTDINGDEMCEKFALLSDDVITTLYKNSQDVVSGNTLGYRVTGPGKLSVNAKNIDLGVSSGIVSAGAAFNPALAKNGLFGAEIDVNVDNTLNLAYSTIQSQAGGLLNVDSKGTIQVGSTVNFPTDASTGRGIYSTAGSPVNVSATGNIEIAGSRIGTYDGGKVTVTSREGNINAGTGGLSLQTIYQTKVDPVTGEVSTVVDFLPGSGILAITLTTGNSTVGDIEVTTPRGDVIANSGGILQAPFNNTPDTSATVYVKAGTGDLSDPAHDYLGKIDARGSGVIGANVTLVANGGVEGVVFATGNASIVSQSHVDVTLIAGGSASVSGSSVTGTIIGIGSVDVTSANIDATLLSGNVTTTGGNNNGTSGFAQGNAAASTSAAAAATESSKTGASTADDDEKRKKDLTKSNRPLIAQTRPRVTVILPGKLN